MQAVRTECARRVLASEKEYRQQLTELRKAFSDGSAVVLFARDLERLVGELDQAERRATALIDALSADQVWASLGAKLKSVEAEYLGMLHAYAVHFSCNILPTLCCTPELGAAADVDGWVVRHGFGTRARLARQLGRPLGRPLCWFVLLTPAASSSSRSEDSAQLASFIDNCSRFVSEAAKELNRGAIRHAAAEINKVVRGASLEVHDGPRMLHQGELMKLYSRGRHVRHFFLFEDRLMYAHTRDSQLRWKKNVMLDTVGRVSIVDAVEPTRDWAFPLQVDRTSRNPPLLLFAPTHEERDFWVTMLHTAQQSHRASSGAPDHGFVPCPAGPRRMSCSRLRDTYPRHVDAVHDFGAAHRSHEDRQGQVYPDERLATSARPSAFPAGAPAGPPSAGSVAAPAGLIYSLQSIGNNSPAATVEHHTAEEESDATTGGRSRAASTGATTDIRSLLPTSACGTPLHGAARMPPQPLTATSRTVGSPPHSPGSCASQPASAAISPQRRLEAAPGGVPPLDSAAPPGMPQPPTASGSAGAGPSSSGETTEGLTLPGLSPLGGNRQSNFAATCPSIHALLQAREGHTSDDSAAGGAWMQPSPPQRHRAALPWQPQCAQLRAVSAPAAHEIGAGAAMPPRSTTANAAAPAPQPPWGGSPGGGPEWARSPATRPPPQLTDAAAAVPVPDDSSDSDIGKDEAEEPGAAEAAASSAPGSRAPEAGTHDVTTLDELFAPAPAAASPAEDSPGGAEPGQPAAALPPAQAPPPLWSQGTVPQRPTHGRSLSATDVEHFSSATMHAPLGSLPGPHGAFDAAVLDPGAQRSAEPQGPAEASGDGTSCGPLETPSRAAGCPPQKPSLETAPIDWSS
eukprot:TRINITY_DN17655_c0_g1_i4.p1 TRINITY_DN17655_c0_g1~~TRINITY_DN17655_c0_g1_i4.p1  ORF type:complete len:857 (+),score=121.39 TRINITY_DN17655_c0_g1_i4:134-2704(+)